MLFRAKILLAATLLTGSCSAAHLRGRRLLGTTAVQGQSVQYICAIDGTSTCSYNADDWEIVAATNTPNKGVLKGCKMRCAVTCTGSCNSYASGAGADAIRGASVTVTGAGAPPPAGGSTTPAAGTPPRAFDTSQRPPIPTAGSRAQGSKKGTQTRPLGPGGQVQGAQLGGVVNYGYQGNYAPLPSQRDGSRMDTSDVVPGSVPVPRTTATGGVQAAQVGSKKGTQTRPLGPGGQVQGAQLGSVVNYGWTGNLAPLPSERNGGGSPRSFRDPAVPPRTGGTTPTGGVQGAQLGGSNPGYGWTGNLAPLPSQRAAGSKKLGGGGRRDRD